MADFVINQITTRSGLSIDIPSPGVLCVVGGNNVGKSQFLRDIQFCLRTDPDRTRSKLISDVTFDLSIDRNNAIEWLISHSIKMKSHEGPDVYTTVSSPQQVSAATFLQFFTSYPKPHIESFIDWLVRSLDAPSRSSIAIQQMGLNSPDQPANAITALFRDGDLESTLSDICDATFGLPITLDRSNGNAIIRVGRPLLDPPAINRPSLEYSDEVLSLPPLIEQGDGVKNYLGMVLHLMTGFESVTIFDEPEAFLHPAQARSLGRHLGQQTQNNDRQLIVATHDRDLVLGLVSSGTQLTMLRINRTGNKNDFSMIDSSIVAEIWSKPFLRYSNLLQGLFHKTVTLCEGDADCQWYASVADGIGGDLGIDAEEILFVPGGGKDQLPASLAALNALNVSTFVIADFDALFNPDLIRKLLNVTGISDDTLIERVSSLGKSLENDGAMKSAKTSGIHGVPSGTSNSLALSILVSLREYQVLIVPVGETESFDKSIGGHGSSWVSSALSKGIHLTCEEARSLVKPIVRSLNR